MANVIVLYDACVLYPAPLRDLLMHLAMTDIYQAKWTNEIHDEWIRNVLANRPDLQQAQLERTRKLMNSNIRDCLVEKYQHLIPSIELPDIHDRHVVAAAIRASATIILTFNLRDFPEKILTPYGIQAIHPDKFLIQLLNLHPDIVCAALHRLRRNLKNPPISIVDYLEILKKQALPQTVKKLITLSDLL